MRYLVLLCVLLTGCATTAPEWNPDSLEPKTVTLHFLDREAWIQFTEDRGACNVDCELIADHVGGVTFWIDGPDNATEDECHIYFPAYRGVPRYEFFVHELRHCYQGPHSEWD